MASSFSVIMNWLSLSLCLLSLKKTIMMRHCDIICLTLSRWDSEISSPSLSLAKEFAKKNRVFYIDHPYSLKDYWQLRHTPAIQNRKQALLHQKQIYHNPSSLPSNITVVTPGLTLPINFLPKGFLYNHLSAINDRIVLKTIRSIIRDFRLTNFIYINFFDPYFVRRLPADIKPVRSVYQSMDDISQVAYSNRHGTRLEREIVASFDYTLCTSKELQRILSVFSPNVYFHPNAADTEIFNKALANDLPRPEELKNINRKIIGYTGSLEYRTDFELLKKVATFHHDKILFFVGPVNTTEHREVGLDKMPNVIFAGPRKITELPNYLRYFDCTLIPFKKTTLTRSIYPLKINEYLAAGKPVIATNFSEDINTFKDVARIADNHEEFIEAIQHAIDQDNPSEVQSRVARAAQNTWTARVEQFWDIIGPDPKLNPGKV